MRIAEIIPTRRWKHARWKQTPTSLSFASRFPLFPGPEEFSVFNSLSPPAAASRRRDAFVRGRATRADFISRANEHDLVKFDGSVRSPLIITRARSAILETASHARYLCSSRRSSRLDTSRFFLRASRLAASRRPTLREVEERSSLVFCLLSSFT